MREREREQARDSERARGREREGERERREREKERERRARAAAIRGYLERGLPDAERRLADSVKALVDEYSVVRGSGAG